MAGPPNPVRAQALVFIASEIDRVGADALDTAAIVRRFVALGASKSRVHTWIAECRAEATDERRTVRAADAARAVADEVAQSAAMLEAEMVAAEVRMLPPGPVIDAMARPAVPDVPASAAELAATGAALAVVPDGARSVLAHLQTVIETATRVLTFSHTPDGKVRNPRMALASAETLRRCLETALKLYESINNIAQVERFMGEVVAELRLLDPALALRVVERMRVVQGRWTH